MTKLSPTFGSLTHLPSPSRTLLNKQAMKDYVYFSDNTKGQTGKAVKIKIDLFPRFAALVDPKTHKGQTIIRQIENLRMVNGASAGVYSNANCAFRYMLQLSNMKVFYAVLDGSFGKEVFIGDVRPDFEVAPDKAGFYHYDEYAMKFREYEQLALDGKAVYLNGLCDDLKSAFKNAKTRLHMANNNVALFYTPGHIINELGVWSSGPSIKLGDSVKKLREGIASNNKNRIAWVAEGEGADVLSVALEGINGSCPGHRYRLIDPITNTLSLLKKLGAKGMKPTGDEVAPVAYTGTNRSARMFMESQKAGIINALKMMKIRGNAEEFHQDVVAKLESTMSTSTMADSKKSLSNTAALNQPARHPKAAAPLTNKAGLSFITALKRVCHEIQA